MSDDKHEFSMSGDMDFWGELTPLMVGRCVLNLVETIVVCAVVVLVVWSFVG